MRILGVDPGSLITGFGVIEYDRGRLVLVEHGCIRPRRGADLPDRLRHIHDDLFGVIQRTAPAAVAVEAPFAGRNVKSLIQLSHARGVILLAAQRAGVELFEYSPRSVKSAIVGFGGAEKTQVEAMVRRLLPACGSDPLTADASDALAIAICHAHSSSVRLRVMER